MPSTILSDNGVSSGSAGLKTTAASDGALALQTTTVGGTATTAVTIDTSQNVGVGTTSPATQLHLSSATPPVIRLQTDTLSSAYGLNWYYTSSASVKGAVTVNLGAAEMRLSVGESGNSYFQTFYTNGSERMRLDASGNWLLGTTTALTKATIYGSGSQLLSLISPTGSSTQVGISLSPSMTTAEATANPAQAAIYATDSSYSANIIFANKVSGALGNALTERARIDSSGNLLVGQTTQSGTTVGSSINPTGVFRVANSSSTNSATTWETYSTGASAYRFYVGFGGQIYATNTTIAGISDQRLKENIRDLDEGLSTVMALQPRKFDWKEGKGADTKNVRGFIAQEFEQVLPDLIDEWKDPAPEGEEPYKSVRADLIPVLVKAIQELNAKVDAQAAEIAALKGN